MPDAEKATNPAAVLAELADGDVIEVRFDPPRREPELGEVALARGSLRRIVGRSFLLADSHRTAWQMPSCLDLDHPALAAVTFIKSASEILEERRTHARGAVVFPRRPASAGEVEEQLSALAEMIASGRETPSRLRELEVQFGEIADQVLLAKRKRTYLLTRARLDQDFHPWTWPDDRVYRNETVRPLPSDFLLDSEARKNRANRLEEAVRIFGEAERETRQISSALSALGYDVRRPHPNAQELRVRFRIGRVAADLAVAPGGNGLWQASPHPAQNKGQEKALARVLRSGALIALQSDLAAAGW